MVADKFLGVPDKVDSRWLAAMLLSICALIFFAQIPIAPPSDSPVSAGGHAPVAAKYFRISTIAAAFFHNSAPKKMAQQGGEDIPGVPHKIALKKRRLNLGVFFRCGIRLF